MADVVNVDFLRKIKERPGKQAAKLQESGESLAARQDFEVRWKKIEFLQGKLSEAFIGKDDDEVNNNVAEILNKATGFSSIEEINQSMSEHDALPVRDKILGSAKYTQLADFRDILPEAMFLMLGDKVNWTQHLSVAEVDQWLPPALKGLGEEMMYHIVQDVELAGVLTASDQILATTSFKSAAEVAGHVRLLDLQLEQVVAMSRDYPGFIEEKSMVVSYLSYKETEAKKVLHEFSRSESVEIPETLEEQLKMARESLDHLEDSGQRMGDIMTTDQSTVLIAMLLDRNGVVEQDVTEEIKARLHLHYLYPQMYSAGGFLNPQIPNSIPNALQAALGAESEINRIDLLFFLKYQKDGQAAENLKNQSNGLNVAKYWNKLMDINYGDNYARKLYEIYNKDGFMEELMKNDKFWKKNHIDPKEYFAAEKNGFLIPLSDGPMVKAEKYGTGNEKQTYMYDPDEVRKEIVRMYLLKDVSTENKTLEARGLALANKLMIATGENATMNSAFAGHDDLAELILTYANFIDRLGKSKTTGSWRAMRAIPSIATTWLRAISKRRDGGKGDEINVTGPLYAEDINVDALRLPKGSEYFYYTAIMMKKLIPVMQSLMAERVKEDQVMNNEFWSGMADCINKVAKYPSRVVEAVRDRDGNPKRYTRAEVTNHLVDAEILSDVILGECPINYTDNQQKAFYAQKEARFKELLVEGMVDLWAGQPEGGMTMTNLDRLGEILTRGNIKSEDGKDLGYFLTEKQWNNIRNAYVDDISLNVEGEIKRSGQAQIEKESNLLENLKKSKGGMAIAGLSRVPKATTSLVRRTIKGKGKKR